MPRVLTTQTRPDDAASAGEGTRAGAHAPVLLLHGARTSRTMWRPQTRVLTRAGIPSLALDLPGHGELLGDRFSLDAAVDAVRDGVDRLGGHALVVGLSLGGYVAVEHRARHPEQSDGLVAAGCSTTPRSRLRDAWMVATRWIERWPDHGARLNATMVNLTLTREAAEHAGAGGFALQVMTDVLREIGRSDTLAALARATSPVWIVNGRYDHFRAGERAMLAAARSSGARARLVVVPHARHFVSLDAPVAFSRILLEAAASAAQRGGSASAEER